MALAPIDGGFLMVRQEFDGPLETLVLDDRLEPISAPSLVDANPARLALQWTSLVQAGNRWLGTVARYDHRALQGGSELGYFVSDEQGRVLRTYRRVRVGTKPVYGVWAAQPDGRARVVFFEDVVGDTSLFELAFSLEAEGGLTERPLLSISRNAGTHELWPSDLLALPDGGFLLAADEWVQKEGELRFATLVTTTHNIAPRYFSIGTQAVSRLLWVNGEVRMLSRDFVDGANAFRVTDEPETAAQLGPALWGGLPFAQGSRSTAANGRLAILVAEPQDLSSYVSPLRLTLLLEGWTTGLDVTGQPEPLRAPWNGDSKFLALPRGGLLATLTTVRDGGQSAEAFFICPPL